MLYAEFSNCSITHEQVTEDEWAWFVHVNLHHIEIGFEDGQKAIEFAKRYERNPEDAYREEIQYLDPYYRPQKSSS